jgi:hypothetical protein
MAIDVTRHDSTALRRILVRAIAGSLVFAAIFTAFGTFGPFADETEFSTEKTLQWLVSVAAAVVAGAVVWMTGKSGTTAGNVAGAANRALIFGILAVVSFPVFWLGIYAVFAAGSFVLGGASIREATGGARAKAIVGVVLAAIATVFCAALNLFG